MAKAGEKQYSSQIEGRPEKAVATLIMDSSAIPVQRSQTALVTGAGGFVGRYLVNGLETRGWTVMTIGTHDPGRENHIHIRHIGDLEAISEAVRRIAPDCVFHTAGMTSGPLTEMYTINTCWADAILMGAKTSRNIPRVMLMGSAAEYGPQTANQAAQYGYAIDEDCRCAPINAYGFSKYAQTMHGLAAAKDQPVIVVRPFNIIGKGMPESLALGRFVVQALKQMDSGEKVIHTGPLHGIRDFVYVGDCVAVLIELMGRSEALGRTVNICSEVPTRLADLVAMLLQFLPADFQVKEKSAKLETTDVFVGKAYALSKMGLRIPPCDFARCIQEMLN